MSKGYTTTPTVAAYLGRVSAGVVTLTTDQQTQADTLINVAEAYIDGESRRAWLLTAITGELYTLLGPKLRLKHAPVLSVTAIQRRTALVGDTWATLTAGTDYELQTPTTGLIRFSTGYYDDYDRNTEVMASIDYVPNVPVPADISHAATLIVAASLYPALFPDRLGVDKVQVDAQTSMEYAENGYAIHVPILAQNIINRYTVPVIG